VGSRLDVPLSGAGTAGSALPFWLRGGGHRVTVLERAPQLRAAGQNVEVRSPGREVLRQMGTEDVALEQKTATAVSVAGSRPAKGSRPAMAVNALDIGHPAPLQTARRLTVRTTPQQVAQGLFEVRLPEPVPRLNQLAGEHSLTGAGQFASALCAQQYPRPQ